ncbi:TonB-dependent receptor [Phenylobacterium sp.]|uniref:TonB-dependent receptor domain-containing protein n=1 Tax=Phenylobacterium sp. TaxID=1871053 RepID=UPI0025E4427E|nr:TonB-dependent receptor [Phenylobacterium sp.]
MMGTRSRGRMALLATSALCAAVGFAGQASAQAASDPSELEEIVVVGSQIQGSKVTAALPVTVVDATQIQATAAGSGDELFRTIPQAGNVTFNSSFLPGSSNSARGDVNSISLRNLGAGNTLVLINGRRTVYHPTTQAESLVPTFTYNTNAIPVAGLKSIEVLRDGAAAIYGTDAVAGVVNTVLRDDFDGGQMEFQYGTATGTNLREGRLTGLFGDNFQEGRGNITIFGSLEKRSALLASDQDYTSMSDRRPLFAGTEFANTVGLDSRPTATGFGAFQAVGVTSAIRQGSTAITGSTGIFHYSPQSVSCTVVVGPGLCIVPGAFNTTTDRAFRVDPVRSLKSSVIPQADRTNIFITGHYDINDDVTFFGEAGYYHARTEGNVAAYNALSTSPTISIGPNAYYNPFGAATLANGQPNPNRLPNLVGVPASGLRLTVNAYGLLDLGPSQVIVKNDQYRVLGGLKGKKFGFNWESAVLYSEATVDDLSYAVDGTALSKAINRTTPDAYNPFNGIGAGTDLVLGGDQTPSSAAAIAGLVIPITRANKTTLALWDFKVNRPDLISMWAGDIGIAAGVEVRRETYRDNRDDNIDGTIQYVDAVTGPIVGSAVAFSNIPGSSVSPDVSGHRTVMSAYAELAVPLVSPEMNIPFVNRLEMQLAGRAEDYSDVGSIAKPKVAAAWDIIPGFRLRGSWSKGFKAPNLEQINVSQVSRTNSRQDYYFCEADLRAKRITSFTQCAQSRTTRAVRAGNPDLKPETSESLSYGFVFQPEFIPPEYGRATVTVDVWKIKQKGIVGLFGEGNAVILDYLLRLQGSSNPAVHRLAPTPDNIAVFTGSGLAPVGFVEYVDDKYVNQLPQVAQGVDVGVNYRLNTDSFGDFTIDVNVARLDKLYQSPTEGLAMLIAARSAGQINAGTIITGGQDIVGQNGTPEWRGTGSLNWRYGKFTANWFTTYTGSFYSTALTYSTGEYFRVPRTWVHNVSVSYTFEDTNKYLNNTRVLVGARNVFDKDPPLVSDGYPASVYNPYGRYLYFNIRKSF